jgi:hypothetical protein
MEIDELEYFIESMFVVAKHSAIKAVLRNDDKYQMLIKVLKHSDVPVDKQGGLAMFLQGYLRNTCSYDWFRKFRKRVANDRITGPTYHRAKLFDPFEFVDSIEVEHIYEDVKDQIEDWVKLHNIVVKYMQERESLRGNLHKYE